MFLMITCSNRVDSEAETQKALYLQGFSLVRLEGLEPPTF